MNQYEFRDLQMKSQKQRKKKQLQILKRRCNSQMTIKVNIFQCFGAPIGKYYTYEMGLRDVP